MSILDKYLPFVKEQYSFHDRMASKFASEPNRYALHKKTSDTFKGLETDILTVNDLLANGTKKVNYE